MTSDPIFRSAAQTTESRSLTAHFKAVSRSLSVKAGTACSGKCRNTRKNKEKLVRVDFRIDLPSRIAAFVAVLVLGIVLVLSPSTQSAAGSAEEGLLTAVTCLLLAGRFGERGWR